MKVIKETTENNGPTIEPWGSLEITLLNSLIALYYDPRDRNVCKVRNQV